MGKESIFIFCSQCVGGFESVGDMGFCSIHSTAVIVALVASGCDKVLL